MIYYIGFTKIRAFVGKCGQKISTSVGLTKIRAFVGKCGQKISTSLGLTKIRAFVRKCGQNCANLLCRNNISRPAGLHVLEQYLGFLTQIKQYRML